MQPSKYSYLGDKISVLCLVVLFRISSQYLVNEQGMISMMDRARQRVSRWYRWRSWVPRAWILIYFLGLEREREFSHCVRVRRYRYTCLSIWDYYFESIFILLAEFKSSSDHIWSHEFKFFWFLGYFYYTAPAPCFQEEQWAFYFLTTLFYEEVRFRTSNTLEASPGYDSNIGWC